MNTYRFVVPITIKTIVDVEIKVTGATCKEAMDKINTGSLTYDEIKIALEQTGQQYKNTELREVFDNALTLEEDFEVGEVSDEDCFGQE